MNIKNSIVVIDSGVGGLNIFYSLKNQFPNENYIFVGDSKYFPYGTKDKNFLGNRLEEMLTYFNEAKAIIIACNTATSVLPLTKPRKNVIGIIGLTAESACAKTKTGNIVCVATNLTIELEGYQKAISKLNKVCLPVKASEFVVIIENKPNLSKEEYDKQMRAIVFEKLNEFKGKNVDTLICGCTHFGYLIEYFKEVLGDINYIISDDAVCENIHNYTSINEVNNPETYIYTTGDAKEFSDKMHSLGFKDSAEHIDL